MSTRDFQSFRPAGPPLDDLGRALQPGDLVHCEPAMVKWVVQSITPNLHPQAPPGTATMMLVAMVPYIVKGGHAVPGVTRLALRAETPQGQKAIAKEAAMVEDAAEPQGES